MIEKTETEVWKATVDFARSLEEVWQPGRAIAVSSFVRPTAPNGFEYEATTGGQTGRREPRWPDTVGQTVVDGSVTWTCRAFSTAATDTIQSINLISSDSALTLGATTETGTETEFTISGGEDGGRYEVSVECTSVGGELIEYKLPVRVVGS